MAMSTGSRNYAKPARPLGGAMGAGGGGLASALSARPMAPAAMAGGGNPGFMGRAAAPSPAMPPTMGRAAPPPSMAAPTGFMSKGGMGGPPVVGAAAPSFPSGPPPMPSAVPGQGTSYPGGFPGIPGTSGTSPTGYPEYQKRDPRTGKKLKLSAWQKKALKNMPPWLQDPTMFTEATGSINDILKRRGAMSPERAIAEEADIETGRGQAQDAIRARLAQAGVDPSDPAYQSMLGTADQGANRLQAESRRARDLQAEQQWRQDLQLITPYLQAMLGYTGPKGAGGVTAAPIGGGGGGTDWGGIAGNIAAQGLQGYLQGVGSR